MIVAAACLSCSTARADEWDVIRDQIGHCWDPPANAKTVVINLKMNRDHTIKQMVAADNNSYKNDQNYKASADAAMDALKQPACKSLKLPDGDYEEWKDVVLTFDPRDKL